MTQFSFGRRPVVVPGETTYRAADAHGRDERECVCVCVTMCVCDRTPALSVCEWAARALSMASSHVCSVHTLSCGIVRSLTRRSFPVHRGVRAHCSLSAAFTRRCRVLPTRHRAQRAPAMPGPVSISKFRGYEHDLRTRLGYSFGLVVTDSLTTTSTKILTMMVVTDSRTTNSTTSFMS